MKKFALALMAAAAVIFGTGVVANAYPPGNAIEIVSDSTPEAGAIFTIEVGCSPVGGSVTFVINTTPPQSFTATCVASSSSLVSGALLTSAPASGTATVSIPAPTTPGTYTITYSGAAAGSVTITVVAAATPPGDLPATGSNSTSTMTIIAIGLFAVGAGLFGVSQVRRRTVAA